jgi:hypothetical protein
MIFLILSRNRAKGVSFLHSLRFVALNFLDPNSTLLLDHPVLSANLSYTLESAIAYYVT